MELLGLSYKNARELNKLIDKRLPRRPQFHHHQIRVADENVSLYTRDIVESLQELYGDPTFTQYLIHRPERHYTMQSGSHERQRVYHDMHTGNWWWEVQVRIYHAS